MAHKTGYRGKKKTTKLFPSDPYNRTKYLVLRTMVMNKHIRAWTTRDLADRLEISQSSIAHSVKLLYTHHYLHRDTIESRQFHRVQYIYVYTMTKKGWKLYNNYEKRNQTLRCLGYPDGEYNLHLRQNLPNPIWIAGDAIHRIAHLNGGKSPSLQGRKRDELYEKYRLEYFKDHPQTEALVREAMKDIIAKLPSWPHLEPVA